MHFIISLAVPTGMGRILTLASAGAKSEAASGPAAPAFASLHEGYETGLAPLAFHPFKPDTRAFTLKKGAINEDFHLDCIDEPSRALQRVRSCSEEVRRLQRLLHEAMSGRPEQGLLHDTMRAPVHAAELGVEVTVFLGNRCFRVRRGSAPVFRCAPCGLRRVFLLLRYEVILMTGALNGLVP